MKIPLLLTILLASALAAPAQLSAPNADGVAMGQVHLIVRDVDANVAFFKLLGGTPVSNGSLHLIEFPGAYIVLEKGAPTGGSVGSIINHFGFQVRAMKDWLPKWQAAGLTIEPITRPTQTYLLTPDNCRIEILEDPTLSTPIAVHHVHFFTPEIPGMQAWYVKTFGAVAGMRGQFQAADVPGINLTFSSTPTPVVPTSGRVLDRIGFEVKDLPAFLAKLQTAGIKLDRPYAKIPGTSIASATLIDPWGSTIELTEGLGASK